MAQRAFIAASALSLLLLALPAPWHLRANNSGTVLYILWSFLGNLVYLVNTIIWSGNTRNIAPIWCDISSKLIIGFNVALSAVSLCIQRRLYRITRVSQVSLTATQKQRDIFIDFAIGLGLPVLVMILHVVVQGHRYDIVEDFGCMPTTYPSYYAYIVILPWPWVLSSISMVYAGLTIRAFLQRRSTFNDLLKTQGTGLNVQRYIRLMALALTEVLLVFPISMIIFVHNVTTSPPKPYRSWAWVHSNFGRISYISRFLLSRDKKTEILFDVSRWCMPVSALLFFIFFGMASEARKQYRRTWYNFLRRFGFAPPEPITSSSHDNKDTPLSPTSNRMRPSFLSKHKRTTTSSSTAPLRSPPIDKKRPDSFAWLDESLDKLDEEEGGLPRQPSLAYLPDTHRARDIGTGYGHTPCTPSTSSSSAFHGYGGHYGSDEGDEGTVGRHASISTAHTGKMRAGKSLSYDYDADDATICGVPTSLKRSDSMSSDTNKMLPGIPFEEFTEFRRERRSGGAVVSTDQDGGERESRIIVPAEQHHDARSSFHIDWFQFPEDQRRSAAMEDQVQIVASPRNSVASSNLEHEDDGLPRIEDHELGGAQVQIFVSSPTNTSFDRSARASRDGLSSVHSSMHDLVSSSSASASVSDEDYRDIHRQSFPRSIMTFDERLTPQMESVPLPSTATNSPSPLSVEVVPSPVETIPSMMVPSPVVESPVTIPSPVTSIATSTPTPTTTTMNSPVTAPQTPLSTQMPPPRPLQIQRLLPVRADSPRPHGGGMLAPPRGGSPKPRGVGGGDIRPSSIMSTATDGGETVFYTPPAGRLSLGPSDFDELEHTPTAASMTKETTD